MFQIYGSSANNCMYDGRAAAVSLLQRNLIWMPLASSCSFSGLAFITVAAEVPPGPKWLRKYESSYVPVARWFSVALFVFAGIAFVYSSLRQMLTR